MRWNLRREDNSRNNDTKKSLSFLGIALCPMEQQPVRIAAGLRNEGNDALENDFA